jgi:hypothetical protein
MKNFKRSKFKAHKCEKVLTEQEIKLLKEAMLVSRQDKDGSQDMSPLLGGARRAESIID